MIKGCEKRVVWIRNTESEMFEQAYFILSESACVRKKSEGDIVAEAKRIIADAPFGGYWTGPVAPSLSKKRHRPSVSVKLAFFAIGFALGMIPTVILTVLLV